MSGKFKIWFSPITSIVPGSGVLAGMLLPTGLVGTNIALPASLNKVTCQ